VISCYGGGFGTMPAFAADFFGPKWVGSIYGLMLTAWGFAGVFGPLLIAAIRQSTGTPERLLPSSRWIQRLARHLGLPSNQFKAEWSILPQSTMPRTL
jgi:MFS family permease